MDRIFKLYVDNVQADVAALVYADGDGATFEDKFTEYCIEILESAGETEGARVCSYNYPGDQGKDWKINGYALRDLYDSEPRKRYYETLDLFITNYSNDYSLNLGKDVFTKGINQLKRFLNSSLKGHIDYLDPALEICELIKVITGQRDSFDRVNLFYLTNFSSNQSLDKINLKGFEDLGIYVHVWDIHRFHRLYQTNENAEPIEIDVHEFLPSEKRGLQCLKVPNINDLYDCYLAIVPGKLLSNLYKEFSNKLLQRNVRVFLQQNGKYNKGIKETIITKPHMFLPYNNGLSATAESVEVKEIDNNLYITKLLDFQIVNGGQTTASLYHTEKNNKQVDLTQIFVQMKLTVIKDAEQKNTEVPYISKFANSQNKVTDLDLSSNNPFLVKIEELSRRKYVTHYANRNSQTLWYFERVNGQYKETLNKLSTAQQRLFKEKNPPDQKFIKSDVSKYISLWDLHPNLVSLGAQKNYDNYLKSIDSQIAKGFLPGDNFYKKLIANAIIYKGVDKLFGRKNVDAIGDTNLKSFTVAYTISYFHYLTQNRLDLWRIYENQSLDDSLVNIFRGLIIFVYNHLVDSANGSLISEYAKKETSWTLLKNSHYNFDMNLLKSYLVSLEEVVSRDKENPVDNVELESEIIILSEITSLGLKFWDGFKIYINKTNEYQELEFDIWDLIKRLKQSKNLDYKGLKAGRKVVNLIKNNEIDIEKMRDLSKIQDDLIIDIKAIYDRMNLLKKEDWSKIISLADQIKLFDNLEFSNLKSVQRMVVNKEKMKETSLVKADESLKKLARFGIVY